MKSLLDLYLEDSQMIITYHTTLRNADLKPPQPGAQFFINDTDVDFLHPLIAVKKQVYTYVLMKALKCKTLGRNSYAGITPCIEQQVPKEL